MKSVPNRFQVKSKVKDTYDSTASNHEGMVWIPAGEFMMGGDNDQARSDEFPKHRVKLNGFYMTNQLGISITIMIKSFVVENY